ncbi:hypothetical protein MNBD_GAMMA06-1226 [hydrothermal vent metagenome]|uniref:Uncharacterized protein n=1 Tax=hydrothermal vent metagenome TaxID=652676 RepID=A0A3B0WP74_9ZZZZ
MKIFFTLFALLAVVLAAYPFINQSEKAETLTGLPWQIEILADGSTQVFGLHIGTSRLSEVIEKLGSDMELAIIAASDEVGNLEMYYGHYRAGLLSGKLVIQTKIDEQKIKHWRDNALKSEYMATGLAKKYTLSADDLLQVLNETVTGLTFIPAVNLDEEVILARFGEPDQYIELAGVTHYLYPAKGLDIALHETSKEVLQYVKPADFFQLVAPLQSR